MPDYRVSGENEEGRLGRISGYLKQKQPKTCVGVSAVVGRAFLQRSQVVFRKFKIFASSHAIEHIISDRATASIIAYRIQ